jgi:hypothetical protein
VLPSLDSKTKQNLLIGLGSLAAIVLLGYIIWGCFHTHGVTVRVLTKSWERAIDIETLKTYRETDTSVPEGGRLIREWTDHYTRRHSRTTYTGFGKDRRSHTEYWYTHHTRQMYDYDIDRWTYTHKMETKGAANLPYWPNVASIHSGILVGCERPAAQYQSYHIEFLSSEFSEEKYTTSKTVSFDEWSKMPIGSIALLRVNEFGYTMEILPLEQ